MLLYHPQALYCGVGGGGGGSGFPWIKIIFFSLHKLESVLVELDELLQVNVSTHQRRHRDTEMEQYL